MTLSLQRVYFIRVLFYTDERVFYKSKKVEHFLQGQQYFLYIYIFGNRANKCLSESLSTYNPLLR